MPDKELARLKKLIELLDEVTADAARLRESVSQSLQRQRHPGGEHLAEAADVAMRRDK
jgi:hypothetical protein